MPCVSIYFHRRWKCAEHERVPFNPKEFKASKGWVSNDGTVIDLVAVGETKAHLVMRNTRRLRADGSLVEEASAFYAYTRTADGWKMFALSGIPLPT